MQIYEICPTNKPLTKSGVAQEASDMPDPATIIGYAFVDAADPCSLAVLTLILMAVITRRPLSMRPERKTVLYAGLSFTAAIFLTYFVFGIVITHAFMLAEEAAGNAYGMLYSALGMAAIVIGLLNIKDAVWPGHHGRGGIADGIPSFLRPRIKSVAETVTSVNVAFLFGVMVTTILLPFTMGPYLITGGILSALGSVSSIPWLILYNVVFVLPMIAITLIVYVEYASVSRIANWRNSMRHLHLLTGFAMLLLGALMVLGLV